MRVIAVDPGTTNTGMVYADERRVICAKTISCRGGVKTDQDALMKRAQSIARQVSDWMADKPHDAVVIEGFITYPSRQNAYTFQTPYLTGYLHAALEGERIVVQTSSEVLNPRKRGNVAMLMDAMVEGREVWGDSAKCTNEHLRAALCHAIYYIEKGDADGR